MSLTPRIRKSPFTETNQYRWPVRAGSNKVGELTSSVYSPRLRKNIGYVMVPPAFGALGTPLIVETEQADASAVVVRRPFVDPNKSLPR